MKKIVLISDENEDEFDSIEELKERLIPNYSLMTKEELKKYMYEKIFGFSMINNLQIVDTSKGVYEGDYQIGNQTIDFNNAIIIDSIDTYIVSLCKFNAIIILEDINDRHYTKDMEANPALEKYIAVNKFANIILKRLVGEI